MKTPKGRVITWMRRFRKSPRNGRRGEATMTGEKRAGSGYAGVSLPGGAQDASMCAAGVLGNGVGLRLCLLQSDAAGASWRAGEDEAGAAALREAVHLHALPG